MVSAYKPVKVGYDSILMKDLPPLSPLFDKKPRVLLVKGGWRASWHYNGMHFMFDAETLPEVIDIWNEFVKLYIYGLEKIIADSRKVFK